MSTPAPPVLLHLFLEDDPGLQARHLEDWMVEVPAGCVFKGFVTLVCACGGQAHFLSSGLAGVVHCEVYGP